MGLFLFVFVCVLFTCFFFWLLVVKFVGVSLVVVVGGSIYVLFLIVRLSNVVELRFELYNLFVFSFVARSFVAKYLG